MKTVLGLFDDVRDAQIAVRGLLQWFDHTDISVLASEVAGGLEGETTDVTLRDVKREAMAEGARTGAGTGAVIGTLGGGALGLLAGIGTIAVPGLGAIVAVGPVLSTLTGAGVGAAAGAAFGGLVGALVRVGVPEHDAHFFTEAVRRGGILVLVQSTDDDARRAADILGDSGAVDVERRREHFEITGFVGRRRPEARAYSVEELARHRAAYHAGLETSAIYP